MKILLSVFACAPHSGSETGVGWHWAVELARAGHQVVALTDATRRGAIERELAVRPVDGLTFVYWRPPVLRRVPLNSRTAQWLYSTWQYLLLPRARALHRQHGFDLAIHLTYGVFRHPSFLGWLGVPFLFGPLGGGEDAPWELKRDLPLREQAKELARALLNQVARWNPMLHLALRRATVVLTKTEETRRLLPASCQARTHIYPEIGIHVTAAAQGSPAQIRAEGQRLELLFAGRLLGWKGVHLALQAVARAVEQGQDVGLTVVGSGPLDEWLRQMEQGLPSLVGRVRWQAHMPQPALFQLYGQVHGFLFPSLHDSSGNVVLEAMSFGLPILCLDLGGPATLVDGECALVVPTARATRSDVVDRLAHAIGLWSRDESRRQRMGQAARRRVASMTWSSRPAGALALLAQHLPADPPRAPCIPPH
jgi:glycosyltransferase involved in cell wall biosynthesis